MVNDDDHQFMAVALAVGFATLSLLASLLTLHLIKRLKKWNGYIQLVVSLTVCQIIYDLSFYFLPLTATWGEYVYVFLNTFGGLTTSLWSNVIILVTARIVIRLRTVDTLKKYRIYLAVVLIPSLAVGLATLVFFNHDTYEDYVIISYFAVRSASIVLNLCAIALIFCKISMMNKRIAQPQAHTQPPQAEVVNTASGHSLNSINYRRSSQDDTHGARSPSAGEDESRAQMTTQQLIVNVRKESTTSPTFVSPPPILPPAPIASPPPHSNPVFLLSKRLVYYCVVQTVARIGSSWYQLAYGFGDGAEYDESEASKLKTIIYLSEFVLNPSAGIGYLIVFLLIQPEAWLELRLMLGCPSKGKLSKKHQRRTVLKDGRHSLGSDRRETYTGSCYSGEASSHHPDSQFSEKDEENLLPDASDDFYIEEEKYETRDSSFTISSNDSSMFPLLDNMTEDDLAREIERRYNPHYRSVSRAGGVPGDDQKVPLIGSNYNHRGW